ncbi:NAD(+) diphosphatase [Desulfococcus sp.]|uniref:NAD(+) diphosphatase n=1 Tax=Desulfococcus sp. TaxID=2025834 RepID=UPI00359484CE
MGDISNTMIFEPSLSFVAGTLSEATALWFLFRQDSLLVEAGADTARIPQSPTPASLDLHLSRILRLGALSGVPCYAGNLADDAPLPDGMAFVNLRQLFGRFDEVVYGLAGTALQTVRWDRTHRYCGRCGAETRLMPTERAAICTTCGVTNHPRISPAVIVAVIREGRILLGRSGRYPGQRLFSVLAGYVELGETLEACVHREVMEEAGIRIQNLKYFGSQPWPFSGSLMVAFTAEWASGEISIDGEEVMEAGWFGPQELPLVPGWGSVAGRLIDWFKHHNPHGDLT